MKNRKHLNAVALPIFVTEVFIFHQDSLLMIKRSETKKKFPGFWSLPGGHIEEGEDALAAAIREVEEETGLHIQPQNVQQKAMAMHHHIDRKELYIVFIFTVNLDAKPKELIACDEGSLHWVKKDEAMTMENVFPPIKYYFMRILNGEQGMIYNYSQWNDSQFVQVLSETVTHG